MKKLYTEGIPGMDYRKLKEAGADGVLMPVSDFSFGPQILYTREQAALDLKRAKDSGLEVYFKVNRFFHEGDTAEIGAFLQDYVGCADGFYYTDPCVYELLKDLGALDKAVMEDDTMLASTYEISSVLEEGVRRVVVSPECTGEEVLRIGASLKNTEVLVYGPLCLSKSRRKFLSAYGMPAELNVSDPTGEYSLTVRETPFGTAVYEKQILDAGNWITRFSGVFDYFQIRNFTADEDALIDTVRYVRKRIDLEEKTLSSLGGFYSHE